MQTPQHISNRSPRGSWGGASDGRHALIIGLGYTGRAIAARLMDEGWSVTGTGRARPDMKGVRGLVFDEVASPELREAIGQADLLISAVPPDKAALADPVLHALPDMAELCRAMVVYLSATSVYGDRGGQWVFEDEPPRPVSRRGLARAEAELAWLETGMPVHVLRLAGIYGAHDGVEERSPFQKMGRAVVKAGHVVNRIHVQDIAELVVRIAAMPRPGLYNVADGHPADPAEVVAHAARLAGAPEPVRVQWTDPCLSEMARSFYAETKRVDIGRAQRGFGWEPRYPSYREGLAQVLAARRPEREQA